jgi:hypothetical protein
MSFDAHVLNVLIASPSDTTRARDVIEKTLHGWNGDRAAREQVILLPRRWEGDSVPLLGDVDGQSVINAQLVDEADILVGIFYSRLGSPTPRDRSGTAEEVERVRAAGKPVHIYFSEMPLPHDVDPSELAELQKFKTDMRTKGLYGSFASEDDLRTKVRSAIEFDLDRMQLGQASAGGRAVQHAILRAHYEVRQYATGGRIDTHGLTHHLIVENTGDVKAEDVTIRITSKDRAPAPMIAADPHPSILPRSRFEFPINGFNEMSNVWEVTMIWLEQGVEMTETQDVSAFG